MKNPVGRPAGRGRGRGVRRTEEDFENYLEEGKEYLKKFFSNRSDLSGMKQNDVEKKGTTEYKDFQASLRKFRDEISRNLGADATQQKKNEEWKKVWMASQDRSRCGPAAPSAT